MRRCVSLGGWFKKVNYLQVFKKDVIIIYPYFGPFSQESAALSAGAKNRAYLPCI
jgi:hypothetical protein